MGNPVAGFPILVYWRAMLNNSKKDAVKRAVATLVAATVGQLIGVRFTDVDMDTIEIVANSGFAAIVNLAYRWSQATLKRGPYEW